MEFLLENIKKDVEELSEKEFLIKYLLKSNNWYFSESKSVRTSRYSTNGNLKGNSK